MKQWKQKKIKYFRNIKQKKDDGEAGIYESLFCFYFMLEVFICLITVAYFIMLGIYLFLICFAGVACACCGEDEWKCWMGVKTYRRFK